MMLSKRQTALYEAVSNIDSKYIDETLSTPIRFTPGAVKRIAAVAAMLAILITAPIWESVFNPTPSPIPVTQSYFFITAKAADGKDTNLLDAGDSFQSSSQSFPLWGDHPTFTFDIALCEFDGNYLFSEDYKLLISYGDKVLDAAKYKDDHIMIGMFLPEKGSTGMCGFFVFGWFEEYTEMEVILKSKDGTVLQEQTIAVDFDGEYTLTLIESTIS